MRTGPLNLLLVDDDESMRLLFELVVNRTGREVQLEMAGGGEQALDYLAGRGPYADRRVHPLPDLLVLDLIMPRVSGFDVLDWIQNSPEFRKIPIIAFSGSARETDREAALAKGAARFILKPSNLDELQNTVAEILDFGRDQRQQG